MLINSQTITRTRLHFNKVIFYYYFKGENNEKVGKGKKLWQMRESFDRRESCQEAAEKGYQQGPKGLEKGKGRKPEGKGLVILLMWYRRLESIQFLPCLSTCFLSAHIFHLG